MSQDPAEQQEQEPMDQTESEERGGDDAGAGTGSNNVPASALGESVDSCRGWCADVPRLMEAVAVVDTSTILPAREVSEGNVVSSCLSNINYLNTKGGDGTGLALINGSNSNNHNNDDNNNNNGSGDAGGIGNQQSAEGQSFVGRVFDCSYRRKGFGWGRWGADPYGGGGDGNDPAPVKVDKSFKLESIGGLTDQIDYLKRFVILPICRPDILREWGVQPPKGILFHGPPGTGKTYMAKAIVNELEKHLKKKVNFYYRKGGDVFSMWFGESQRQLREVFQVAKSTPPAVLFFDEIDGLCPSREHSHTHGTEAYSGVVTCFLGQMDELKNGEVFVIGATNRLEAVDPAVRRPGRFDKHLAFGFPDENARQKIIEIHTRKWAKAADRPNGDLLRMLAQRTPGFSGADLEKLCTDVVYKAIEAYGGKMDENQQVTEVHWMQALRSMQPTASNSFGSTLLIPTPPCRMVAKLIEPVVTATANKVRPYLTQQSLETTFMKSSLIYMTNPGPTENFLNFQILPGILSDPVFNKVSIYELSLAMALDKVRRGIQPTLYAVINNVVTQALDSENTAMVVIPGLSELLQVCNANELRENLVFKLLYRLRGPKTLLLATSSEPLKKYSELFDQNLHVDNPKEEFLYEFFQFALQDKLAQADTKESQENLLNLAMRAAELAQNDRYELVLNLANELAQLPLGNQETGQRADLIFATYAKNRNQSM